MNAILCFFEFLFTFCHFSSFESMFYSGFSLHYIYVLIIILLRFLFSSIFFKGNLWILHFSNFPPFHSMDQELGKETNENVSLYKKIIFDFSQKISIQLVTKKSLK